jgi:signal peptidase I
MIEGELHINGNAVKRERMDDFVDREDGRRMRARQWRERLPNGVSYATLDLVEAGAYDNTPVYRVPARHYFLVGDNRDNAIDSRLFERVGYVPRSALVASVLRVYWSRDFSRIGTRVG